MEDGTEAEADPEPPESEAVFAVAKKYGATIASDGWGDVRCRPILNFMASTRGAAVFFKSVDCTDQKATQGGKKYAAYIESNIISIINEIGDAQCTCSC